MTDAIIDVARHTFEDLQNGYFVRLPTGTKAVVYNLQVMVVAVAPWPRGKSKHAWYKRAT